MVTMTQLLKIPLDLPLEKAEVPVAGHDKVGASKFQRTPCVRRSEIARRNHA